MAITNYWDLKSTTTDKVGGNNGTLVGSGRAFVNGMLGGCLAVNVSALNGDGMTISQINLPTYWSLSMLLISVNTASYEMITGAPTLYYMGLGYSKGYFVSFINPVEYNIPIPSPDAPQLNKVFHLCLTYNSGSVNLYLNGKYIDNVTYPSSQVITQFFRYLSTTTHGFRGYGADIIINNEVQSPAMIKNRYSKYKGFF